MKIINIFIYFSSRTPAIFQLREYQSLFLCIKRNKLIQFSFLFRVTMDLPRAMSEAQLAIDYFFNNKFVEARAIMKPWYIFLSSVHFHKELLIRKVYILQGSYFHLPRRWRISICILICHSYVRQGDDSRSEP